MLHPCNGIEARWTGFTGAGRRGASPWGRRPCPCSFPFRRRARRLWKRGVLVGGDFDPSQTQRTCVVKELAGCALQLVAAIAVEAPHFLTPCARVHQPDRARNFNQASSGSRLAGRGGDFQVVRYSREGQAGRRRMFAPFLNARSHARRRGFDLEDVGAVAVIVVTAP